jgi:hypothetical protein
MKQACLVVFLATLLCCAQAQTSNPYSNQILKQLTPISPEAAALGKYGNVPVSMYTGVPNISVPLYEIAVGGFKLPISLSYHAGGNKVDDVASWVGTGWSLQAGGVINRQQRGVYDERMIEFYPGLKNMVDIILDPNSTEAQRLSAASAMGPNFDTEPDIFSFNFPGHSGKLFLDPDGNYYTAPKLDKVTFTFKDQGRHTPANNRSFYARWIVAGHDGVKYVFGRTQDGSKSYLDVSCTYGNAGYSCEDVVSVNTWHLNEIILPNDQRIKFTYELFTYDLPNIPSATTVVSTDMNCFDESSSAGYLRYTQVCRLTEIQYPGGKVTFEPGDARVDVPGDKFLKRIIVSAQDGSTYKTIKQYELTYANGSRLRLNQVDEVGTDNVRKPHRFIYNIMALPARGNPAQDLWGYYNGQLNTDLKPSFFVLNSQGGVANAINSGNRAVDPAYTQAGILKEIVYPTGGSTKFEYENNTVTCRNAYEEASRERVSTYALQNNTLTVTDPFSLVATGLSETFRFRVEASSPDCSLSNGLWDCLDLQLQKKGSDGNFQVSVASLKNATDYTLTPGAYRVEAVWRVPASMRLNLTVRWNGILTDSDPRLCEILDHTYMYPTRQGGTNAMFYHNTAVEYSDLFTIPSIDPGLLHLKVDLHGSNCDVDQASQLLKCALVDIERLNSNGTYTTALSSIRHGYNYSFSPGTYRVKFMWNSGATSMFAGVTLSWPELMISPALNVAQGERFGGGLRIKRVTDYDNVTQRTVVKTYSYNYTEEDGTAFNGVTSGALMNVPLYWYSYLFCSNGRFCQGDAFTSQSQSNVLSQDGINVGYSVVTEQVQGISNAGKEEFRFTTAFDYPDGGMFASTVYPFVASTSYEWRRGKQVRRKATVNNALSEQENQQYIFNGTTTDPNYKKIPCVKIFPIPAVSVGGGGSACAAGSYQPAVYSMISESFFVSQARFEKTSTRNSANSMVTQTNTVQDAVTLQPARVETSDSRNVVVRSYTKYAANYSLPGTLQGPSAGIRKLIDYNMQTMPVEQYVTHTGPDGIEYVVEGSISVYGATQPVVEKLYQLTIAQPKPLAAFTPSSVLSDGSFQKDADYVEVASFTFNTDLTLQEQSRPDDAPKAYLWDYSSQYVVASADNGSVNEIAYTSFEGTTKGNFTFTGTATPDNTAISGKWSYDLSMGAITRNGLAVEQDYLVSYWYKSGAAVSVIGGVKTAVRAADLVKDGWSFRQVKVTGAASITLSGSGLVDEIRIHPVRTQMTSYTYDVGVGVSSVTDVNNKITYYEYDTFNRLKLVRDNTGQIKDNFQYHYTNQQ